VPEHERRARVAGFAQMHAREAVRRLEL